MSLTETTRLKLAKYAAGDVGWDVGLNAGMDNADARFFKENAGNPNGTVTSDYIGQRCWDSTNEVWWTAVTAAVNNAWQMDVNTPGGRNRVINGDFSVWQRGTSFTATGPVADCWRADLGTGGAATISRQSFTVGQTDVPFEPEYHLRWAHTTNSSSAPTLHSRIESVRTLAGQQATISFYAKANATLAVTGVMRQCFGSGGSADVDTSMGSAFSVGTSWARYSATITIPSINLKTVGTSDYLEIRLSMPTGATFTLDVKFVQIEAGPVVTAFETMPFAEMLRKCLRYYCKTFDYGVTPAQNAGFAGSLVAQAGGVFVVTNWQFTVDMRVAPTVATYSPNASSSDWSTNGSAPTVVLGTAGTRSTWIQGTGAIDTGFFHVHATAQDPVI